MWTSYTMDSLTHWIPKFTCTYTSSLALNDGPFWRCSKDENCSYCRCLNRCCLQCRWLSDYLPSMFTSTAMVSFVSFVIAGCSAKACAWNRHDPMEPCCLDAEVDGLVSLWCCFRWWFDFKLFEMRGRCLLNKWRTRRFVSFCGRSQRSTCLCVHSRKPPSDGSRSHLLASNQCRQDRSFSNLGIWSCEGPFQNWISGLIREEVRISTGTGFRN